jgi:hypothetical protein
MGMACSTNGSDENAKKILIGITEGKKPLLKPRRIWEDNIETDFREIGWEGVDWIHLAQDRDQWRAAVDMVTNVRVP